MRAKYPEINSEEIEQLRPTPWMLELLKKNPSYMGWGPGEDYMNSPAKEKEASGRGWDGSLQFKSWKDFGPWSLDDLNECVNFYFAIERDSKWCEKCDGQGYNERTSRLANDFYGPLGWSKQLTEDELKALKENNRVGHGATLEDVNNGRALGPLGHDAINRWILIETRARRLGFWGKCEKCEGLGEVFTQKNSHISLTLWFLHPRKGCSRGVIINKIKEEELPEVFKFLKHAAKRNADRFGKI